MAFQMSGNDQRVDAQTGDLDEIQEAADAKIITEKSASCRPADTPEVAPRKGRSRVTNGKILIGGVDQRNPWVRRCKDILREHLSDIPEGASTAERSLLKRAAVLTTELEQMETKFARAGQADAEGLEVYQRATNTLRRLLEAVGLQRRARELNPLGEDPDAYLRRHYPAEVEGQP